VISPAVSPKGNNACSALTDIVVPAPTVSGSKPVRKRFRVRGFSVDQRRDSDKLILECYR
jgi:hypothetical protein